MSILSRILDAVYPHRCYACDEPSTHAGFCDRCTSAIRPPSRSSCAICGQPFATVDGADHLCGRCLRKRPAFARARACALLHARNDADPLRRALHRYKYRPDPCLARGLGRLFTERGCDLAGTPDVIVPVPLHLDRLRWRGFNQSILLARHLQRSLGTPLEVDALERLRPTAPQVELDETARRRNVAGAFAVTDVSVVRGRRILLVDDVLTTGSTVQACSLALLRAGAGSVDVLVLARAVVA